MKPISKTLIVKLITFAGLVACAGTIVADDSEPWVKWARNPVTIPLTIVATNIQAGIESPVTVSLANGTVTQLGAGCNPSSQTNSQAFMANMKVRRECLLTLVASNFDSAELRLSFKPNWTPPNRKRYESRPKNYRLLVDRVWDAGGIIEVKNPNGCSYYSNSWRIELNERLPANWRLEDASNDPKPPGDGTWAEIGPGKSLDKAQASIAWSVSLGKLFDGTAAGRLSIRESRISPEIYSSTNIYYTAGSEVVRDAASIITDAAGSTALRQVKSYQAFVDIVSVSNGTEMRFYFPSQVGTATNALGHYTSFSGTPFVVWALVNPNAPNTNTLLIIERRNGNSSTNEIICDIDSSTATWTLRYGKDLEKRVETRGVVITTSPATNRLETVDVRYAGADSPAYRAMETYHLFPWGFELVETRIDPDNNPGTANDLVTSFAYYTDSGAPESYTKPWIITYPDGYWEKRLYNNEVFLGTMQYALHPDRDSPSNPTNATLADCIVDGFNYDWNESEWGNFRGITTYYHPDQQDVSHLKATRINLMWQQEGAWLNQSLDLLSIPHDQEGVGNFPGPSVDGPSMVGTWAESPDEFWGLGYFGHDFFRHDTAKGMSMEVSYYHSGTYDTNNHSFSPKISRVSEGPDWRQCTIHTGRTDLDWLSSPVLVASAEGETLYWEGGGTGAPLYPLRSWRDAFIYRNGALAQRELHVFTGVNGGHEPQFAPVAMWVYLSDSLGRTTNIVRIDGTNGAQRTVYDADYRGANQFDGDLLLSETSEQGIKTVYAYDTLKRLVTSTKVGTSSPLQPDITASMKYDAYGRRLSRTNSAAGLALGTSMSYDLAGRVVSQTNTNGMFTSFTYDLGGRLTTTTLPSGLTEIRENYLDRRLKSLTGTGAVNEYHDWGFLELEARRTNLLFRVATIHNIQLGSPTSTRIIKEGIDLAGRVIRREIPDWNNTNGVVEYTGYFSRQYAIPNCFYNSARGELMPVWVNYLEFDGSTNISSVPIEDTYRYGWYDLNSKHRMTSSTSQFNTNQSGHWFKYTTNLVYQNENNITPTIASITQERLNGFGSCNALSEVTTWDADTNATITSASLDRTAKRLTEVSDVPHSTINPTRITINGLLQSENSASVSKPVQYGYDGLGRGVGVTNSLGFASTTAYNSAGQVSASSDFTGLSTSYQYFLNGELGAGQPKRLTTGGKSTYYAYTSFGLWHVWGDVPYPEERLYSQFGEMVELRTFRGGTGWNNASWPTNPGPFDKTTWTYQEASGLLAAKTDNSDKSASYTYGKSLPETRRCARGLTVTNGYNEVGELTRRDYSDGSSVVFTNQTYSRFDRLGRPQVTVDAAGTNVLTYDHAGRLVSTSYTGGLMTGITVSNHFNSVYGRDVLQVTGTSPGMAEQFSYDAYGRLASVCSGMYSATYGYLPDSDLTQTTAFKNNATPVMTTTRAWEYGSRIRSINNAANAAPVTSHTYQYDGLNRRIRATLEDGSQWVYEYNDRNELISGHRNWYDSTPVSGQQFAYDYDSLGNRKSAGSGGDTGGGNLRTTAYWANALNQYTNILTPGYKDILGFAIFTNGVTVNSAAADRKVEYFHREIAVANGSGPVWQNVNVTCGTASTNGGLVFSDDDQRLTYDLDGNLTFDGIWIYTWDAENRLTAMTMTNVAGIMVSNRLRLQFVYDYQGRRVQKIVSTNSTGNIFVPQSTNRFVYDGWNLIATLNPQSSVLQSFNWGQDLSGTEDGAGGIGGLVAVCEYGGGQLTNANFCAYDCNGNITALIRASDSLTSSRYEYSPYGELIRATGPLAKVNPFRWSTKFWDQESGLVFYGYRFYSPTLGRWISRDPLEENGGINLSAFVKNNPTGAFDPDGRFLDTLMAVAEGVGADAVDALKGASARWRIQTFVKKLEAIEQFKDGIMAAEDMLGGLVGIDDWIGELNSLKLQATKKPLSTLSTHNHHMIPSAVQLDIGSMISGKIKPDDFLVRMEEKLHLKGLHGPAGGRYVDLWRRAIAQYGKEMRNPAWVIGFALGAMDKLGLGSFPIVP